MKNKFIMFILMLTMILSLASCGFVVEEEGLIIESITSEVVKEGEYKGQTKVTITYANVDEDPSVFYIPKGEDGIEGVGIDDIQALPADNGDKIIQITLSTGEVKTYTAESPVSIVETFRIEKEGKYYLVVKYSNDETDEIPLEEGPAGKDGLNCTDVEKVGLVTDKNNEFYGWFEFKLIFTDGKENGERAEQSIYTKPGDNGNGISGITHSSDEDFYYITIVYTGKDSNGDTTKKLQFPIKKVEWHSGTDEVVNEDLGNDGDFYFDTKRGYIYQKENGGWEMKCQLNLVEQAEKVKVTFDLNANDDKTAKYENDKLLLNDPTTGTKYYSLNKNYNFASLNVDLPTASRDGYKFLGWYSVRNPKEYINSAFTDFTTVPSDIKLYACWEKIEG